MPAPLEDHMAILVQRLAALRVPHIVGEIDKADMLDLADHTIEVAYAVDAYYRAIGRGAAANATGLDETLFDHPVLNAIDGNLLFALHSAAEALDEDDDAERAA